MCRAGPWLLTWSNNLTPEEAAKVLSREEIARSWARRGTNPLQEVRVWAGTVRDRAAAGLRADSKREMVQDMAGCQPALVRIEELVAGDPQLAPSDVWNIADIALLAGCSDISRNMLERLDPSAGTPFWRAYVASQLALHRGQPWRLPEGLLMKGADTLFRAHMEMVEALSQGQKPDLERVDVEFRARNSQKRWVDWSLLDGDAETPVHWNLRKEAALGRVEDRGKKIGTRCEGREE